MAQSMPEPIKLPKTKCPICGEPAEYESRPFCSRRCANIDLYRWLSNGYAIPGDEDGDEDGDDSAARDIRKQPTGRDDDQPA